MMLTTPVATLNRLSLSESDTNPVISGQLQKILQVTFGYLQTVPAISVLFKGGNSNAQNLNCETFVGTSKSNLHQSPEFNGDRYSAKYSAQQTPLKNGNSPSLPVRRNLLIKLNCAETGQLANSLILSRNAQSVCREIKGEQCSGSAEHYRYSGSSEYKLYLGSLTILNGCNYENQQVKSKEKGGILNSTLWDYSDGSALDFLRCSILSLRPHASSTQEEKLALGFSSLSRSTLASISSIKSLGNRIPLYVDLLFLWPVAMMPAIWSFFNRNDNTTRFKLSEVFKQNMVDVFKQIELICLNTLSTGKAQVINKIATPQSAGTLLRRLTTNVNVSNEVAMLNHTQTRPKFQYLFLAVCRSDLNATPHRESVTAHSEQDARRSLAGQFVLSFAGRVPAQGVCNA